MSQYQIVVCAILGGLLVFVLWRMHRADLTNRKILDANKNAIDTNQRIFDQNSEIMDVAREQINLQVEANKLMRELISALRDSQ